MDLDNGPFFLVVYEGHYYYTIFSLSQGPITKTTSNLLKRVIWTLTQFTGLGL